MEERLYTFSAMFTAEPDLSGIFILKQVKKIPKYATKEGYTMKWTMGDDEEIFNDVHVIKRHYKRRPFAVYFYLYYKEEK